jgi:hypothetical protein
VFASVVVVIAKVVVKFFLSVKIDCVKFDTFSLFLVNSIKLNEDLVDEEIFDKIDSLFIDDFNMFNIRFCLVLGILLNFCSNSSKFLDVYEVLKDLFKVNKKISVKNIFGMIYAI